MIAQPFGPCRRSQNRFYAIEQSAPRVIKIIKVMVVAEQYSIYAAERLRAECGGSSFSQRVHARWIFLVCRIERGIGKQPQFGHFEQRCRSADRYK